MSVVSLRGAALILDLNRHVLDSEVASQPLARGPQEGVDASVTGSNQVA